MLLNNFKEQEDLKTGFATELKYVYVILREFVTNFEWLRELFLHLFTEKKELVRLTSCLLSDRRYCQAEIMDVCSGMDVTQSEHQKGQLVHPYKIE